MARLNEQTPETPIHLLTGRKADVFKVSHNNNELMTLCYHFVIVNHEDAIGMMPKGTGNGTIVNAQSPIGDIPLPPSVSSLSLRISLSYTNRRTDRQIGKKTVNQRDRERVINRYRQTYNQID